MIEYMLARVIEDVFEKQVGKGQCTASRKALHVGFNMRVVGAQQYRVKHLYLYAPMNYVHVAVQEECISAEGERSIGKMESLCYHDSCWRDAIQKFIFTERLHLNGFHTLGSLSNWCDVLTLSEQEEKYLHLLEKHFRLWHASNAPERRAVEVLMKDCPFDKRSIWVRR